MTRKEALKAMKDRARVCGGAPGTEDYDTGWIMEINDDVAFVSWDSGVAANAAIDGLAFVSDHP